VALGAFIWAAVDQFDISLDEMAGLFLGTLWVAGGIILGAAVFVIAVVGLRKLLQGRDSS